MRRPGLPACPREAESSVPRAAMICIFPPNFVFVNNLSLKTKKCETSIVISLDRCQDSVCL